MNEDMKIGAILALQGVKEELMTVRAELRRKGFEHRKGFTTIEAYIDDQMKGTRLADVTELLNIYKRCVK